MITLQQQAEALLTKLQYNAITEGGYFYNPDDVLADVLAFAEQIQAQERQRCAWIARDFPWTLSAGSESIPMIDMDALVDAIMEQDPS